MAQNFGIHHVTKKEVNKTLQSQKNQTCKEKESMDLEINVIIHA